MREWLTRFAKNRHANAATEFAFILPIMLLFIGGIVEFGRAFMAYNAVNRLATRYAIAYADCFDNPTGTCDNNAGHEIALLSAPAAVQNIAPQLNPTPVPRIFEVLMSAASPPVPSIVYNSSGATSLTSAEIAQTQVLIGPGQYAIGPGKYGVVVSVSYTYAPLFFANFVPSSLGTRQIAYIVAQQKN